MHKLELENLSIIVFQRNIDIDIEIDTCTGRFFNVSKVISLWESLKIQNTSWDWFFHFTEIGPFRDLVSKKLNSHSVIIHLWRLRRCIFSEISKIHWKSMIEKQQYCFANISAKNARIFMKFYFYFTLVGLNFFNTI